MTSARVWWLRLMMALSLALRVRQLAVAKDVEVGNERGEIVCSPSLFMFGASMMDTGENAAVMPFRSYAENPPYGRDYWGHPANRLSNGRVITDHLCQTLGQAFLNPYLQFGATQFLQGVNFASSGATAISNSPESHGPNICVFPLQTQIDQFQVFKNISLSRGGGDSNFPKSEDFAEGIYVLEFGTNDFMRLQHDYENVSIFHRDLMSSKERAIERLYSEGARNIILFNVLPLGCTPGTIAGRKPKELDEYGCFSILNRAVARYNSILETYMADLRRRLSLVNLVLFDFNKVWLDAISNPSQYGLKYVHASCCGAGGGEYNYMPHVHCGSKTSHNGFLATACENPIDYIFWDYVHPTDSFAGHIAAALVSGAYSKPAFKLNHNQPCPQQNSKGE